MQIVKNSFAKLSNYPRLRVLVIIVGLIVLFIIGMNLFSSGDSANKPSAPPSRISPITSRVSEPVAPVQQKNYENLANKVDTAETTQEIQGGQTVFSNVFGGTSTAVNPQKPTQTKAQATANTQPASAGANAPSQGQVISPEQAAANGQQAQKGSANANNAANQNNSQLNQNLSNQQQQLLYQQQQQAAYQQQQAEMQKQQQLMQLQQSMSSSIQNMQDSWKLPSQTVVQSSQPSNSGGASGASSAPQGPVAIKAGTIMFAVVQTALDSDQPGTPVMATIVTGPYTGALLLGNFKLEGEKLVVTFSQMSLKSQPSTVGIGTAYAIDSQTANNAVATSVDNHYLLRYGMLFAASFLQGFGSAYQSYTYQCPPNTTNCTVINGTSGVPSTTATTKTAMYQGFGQVGTNLGQVAANQFNTPPTVTLAQGTGIGVLFMNDVRIP
ncbi:MAG: conjugal transfer protein TrbI [Gammaproteobacteria bacterium]|jgi:intracellular multiplication protein IcmE|nr:conjugal transfer protein TrbI [Gammaproteobacteria bacterium]